MTGIVAVVPQRAAFPFRRGRQQNAGSLQIVNEEVAPPAEKAQWPQGFDDQLPKVGRIAPALLAMVKSLDDLHRLIDFGPNPFFEQQFGTDPQMLKITFDISRFLFQQGTVIASQFRFHGVQAAFKQANVLADKIAAQRQGQGQYQRQ